MMLLRERHHIVQVLELLVFDAGGVVAVGDDVERGGTVPDGNFKQFLNAFFAVARAVEPRECRNRAGFEDELVHVSHQRK